MTRKEKQEATQQRRKQLQAEFLDMLQTRFSAQVKAGLNSTEAMRKAAAAADVLPPRPKSKPARRISGSSKTPCGKFAWLCGNS